MIKFISTPRKMMSIAWGVSLGACSALILAYGMAHAGSVAVFLVYLAPIPLFLAGLGGGTLSCFVAAVIGALGLAAFTQPNFAAFYILIDALPAVCLTLAALRAPQEKDGVKIWRGEGAVLTLLALYPCLCFLAIYAATFQQHGGLLAMTLDAYNGLGDQVNKMLADNGQTVTPEITAQIHHSFAFMARVTPALAMCAWLFSTLIALLAAQGLLGGQSLNLRPSFTLANLYVPNGMIFAAALTGLMAFAPAPYDYVGLNLAVIMALPFFFVGLAVIHAWAHCRKHPAVTLTLFYIALGIVIHIALLVAVLGAVDQWVDFRTRLRRDLLTNKEGERK